MNESIRTSAEQPEAPAALCDFGKHKGQPYASIPTAYLRWMVEAGHSRADLARLELSRRREAQPAIEIRGEAIDALSRTFSTAGPWPVLESVSREGGSGGLDWSGPARAGALLHERALKVNRGRF